MASSSPDGAHLVSTPDVVFNGIDATTGEYLHPRISLEEVRRIALGLPPDPRQVAEARGWRQKLLARDLSAREGIDPKDLATAGWGVIFAHRADPAVREALGELLAHRRQQAARVKEIHYREFRGEDGYRPGESKLAFLARHGAGPGPADPARVPFYLLLVGSPEEIPYLFQSHLDLQYAVGRLSFATAEEYARYARGVVAAEKRGTARGRTVLFGVRNPGDRTTGLTCEYLVKRVAAFLAADQPAWTVDTVLEGEATKARLGRLLGGDETPDLLFSASHGMKFPKDDPRLLTHQGALLCHDWPGPGAWKGPIPEDHYFAAGDVGSEARAEGLIAFHYACHGAGTPRLDAYAQRLEGAPRELAPHPFVACLPQRLLGHPRGSALAVVGHVERSWGYSFIWQGAGGQSQVFEDALKRLLEGHPLGSALEPFDLRYAELAAELAAELEQAEFGTPAADPELIPRLWTAANDARNYVVLGDPAVRLPAPEASSARERR